jgi:hypothetical protein
MTRRVKNHLKTILTLFVMVGVILSIVIAPVGFFLICGVVAMVIIYTLVYDQFDDQNLWEDRE